METPQSSSPDLEAIKVLPDIPMGYIRLTHFTTSRIADKLIGGEDFTYNVVLDSTTDSFTSNDGVLDLLRTGRVRNSGLIRPEWKFGNAMVIIDLEAKEHKDRRPGTLVRDRSIPNHNILGYMLRENQDKLVKNARYNPQKNDLNYLPTGKQAILGGRIKKGSTVVPQAVKELDLDDDSLWE